MVSCQWQFMWARRDAVCALPFKGLSFLVSVPLGRIQVGCRHMLVSCAGCSAHISLSKTAQDILGKKSAVPWQGSRCREQE